MTKTKVYLLNTFSIVTPVIGAVYVFYSITVSKIDRMEDFNSQYMVRMEQFHREDIKSHKEDMVRIDEKWERLFEKLLVKEQGK